MSDLRDFVFVLFFALVLTVLILGAIITIFDTLGQYPSFPQCHEDVVLVGIGDFENGRWDSYICGPAVDDYLY